MLPGEVTVDEPSRAARKRWYRRLALVLLVSVFGVVLLAALGAVDLDTLGDDLAKTLLQLGLVSVGAAVLSWFSYEYQQERLRGEARQEWLMQLLARATVAYNDVKGARRLLRGRAIAPGEGGQEIVYLDDYDDQIDVISKAQLQFETLADEVEVVGATGIPSTAAASLAEEFQKMEDSLQRLVREYQRERAQFSGEPATLGLNRLPQLDAFRRHLGGEHRDDPVEDFAPVRKRFHDIQRLILQELVREGPQRKP